MSADTNSIFYQIGQATKTNVTNAITALKAANNTWTGTNDFQENVSVGTSGSAKNFKVWGTSEVTSNLTVGGNLTVNGTTTSIQTTNTEIKDNIVVINEGANDTATEASDGGFLFERASGTENGAFLFEESNDRFELGLTSGTGAAVSLGNVSLGALAINSLLIGTRASTQALGDLADFNAGLSA
jgi:hypothetical protein